MSIWISEESAPPIPQLSGEVSLRIQNLMVGIHSVINTEKIAPDLLSLSPTGGMCVIPTMIPDIKI